MVSNAQFRNSGAGVFVGSAGIKVSQYVEGGADAGGTHPVVRLTDTDPNTEFAMLLSVEMMVSDTMTVLVPDTLSSSLKTSPKLFVVVAAWRSEMLVLGGSVAFGVVVRLVILTVSGGRVKGNCRSHDERSDRMAGSS